MRKFIVLFIALFLFIYAQDARTRAYIHAVVKDSALVMRGTLKDTATVLRTEIDADGDIIRGEFADSVDGVARTIDSAWTFSHNVTMDSVVYWSSGNVIYVPLGADIQTYVDAADSGSTLILASGKYTITDTININKPLNIKGQGSAGFATTPVTPSHGTLISCATANMVTFWISSDNVRISDLSINMTGATPMGIATSTDLVGIVLMDIDVLIVATGAVSGFNIFGSTTIMRDVSFYVTSSNSSAAGVLFWNNNTTSIDAILDCFNVTGTAVGAATYAYAFACWNINDANTLTLNLSNSVCEALSGTAADIACVAYSVTTSSSTINAYLCTFDGADYDIFQNNSNVVNLGGTVLVNNNVSGTVTYRASVVAGDVKADSGFVTYITGGKKVAADTLSSYNWTAISGGLGTAVISAVKVNVPAIECNYTSCLLDSFKLNAAEDTLFFFVGGKKFMAVP